MSTQQIHQPADSPDTSAENGRQRPKLPAAAVARDMREVARDAMTLAELQVGLVAKELKESKSRLFRVAAFGAATALLMVPCLIVLLTAEGHLLHELGLSLSASFGLAALTGILLAAGCGLLCRRALTHGPLLQRSKREFHNNLAWIKRVTSELRS